MNLVPFDGLPLPGGRLFFCWVFFRTPTLGRIVEEVTGRAFEPLAYRGERFERHILLAPFDPMQRARVQAKLWSEVPKRGFASQKPQPFSKRSRKIAHQNMPCFSCGLKATNRDTIRTEISNAPAVLRHPRTLDIMTTAPTTATQNASSNDSRASALASEYAIRPMQESHIGQAVSLVSRAMNIEEGGYAAQTLHLHFSSRKSGVDDGRVLFVLANASKLVGLVGLHHYAWGPPENVWLSWFALDPLLQGQGLAPRLLDAVIAEAQKQRYMKFFIETYSTPEFARARAFYRAQGFEEVGTIPGWLPNDGSMVVLYKDLTSCA